LLRSESVTPTKPSNRKKLDFIDIEDIVEKKELARHQSNEKLDCNIFVSIIKSAGPKRRKARLDEASDLCHKESLLEWSCLWRGNFTTLKRTPI